MPVIQGVPISRETIAAWQVILPSSVTIAVAFFMAQIYSGRVMEAMKVMSEFNESYKDVLPGPVAGPTAASVKKAGFERLAPPWLAKRMPVGLRSSEYAFGPPASLWSTLASEVSP